MCLISSCDEITSLTGRGHKVQTSYDRTMISIRSPFVLLFNPMSYTTRTYLLKSKVFKGFKSPSSSHQICMVIITLWGGYKIEVYRFMSILRRNRSSLHSKAKLMISFNENVSEFGIAAIFHILIWQ